MVAMTSRREQILATLFDRFRTTLAATVRRNEALPERVPAEGLVILRDGDPGEPDFTLNPRTEFYSHRVELEIYLTQPAGGGGEEQLDALIADAHAAFAPDPALGGLAENLTVTAPETGVLAIEGAASVLTASMGIIVDYLVTDPLAV